MRHEELRRRAARRELGALRQAQARVRQRLDAAARLLGAELKGRVQGRQPRAERGVHVGLEPSANCHAVRLARGLQPGESTKESAVFSNTIRDRRAVYTLHARTAEFPPSC